MIPGLPPIFAALRRNKIGAMLIGLQIALTLAVMCNALFIVQQRLADMARGSGTDEADLFAITNDWIRSEDHASQVSNDLAALRAMPGVVDAYVTNCYPLTNSGWSDGLSIEPPDGKRAPAAEAANYFSDAQTLQTLGLRLIAGRNFNAADVVDRTRYSDPSFRGIIITQALARKLFPDAADAGAAVGRRVYFESQTRTTPIIGVVAQLQTPWVSGSFGTGFVDYSVLAPYRYVDDEAFYVVRAKPGQLASVMKVVQQRLMALDSERVIEKMQPFSKARSDVYRNDRGLALILLTVCTALLAVLAFGLVGLTSYWVSQRRRQIGIRRALGATQLAIVRHFQLENLIIVAAGGIAGAMLGLAANVWMVESLRMTRLPANYLVVGLGVVLALGQLAVVWPALRAGQVPPALATRAA